MHKAGGNGGANPMQATPGSHLKHRDFILFMLSRQQSRIWGDKGHFNVALVTLALKTRISPMRVANDSGV